VIAGGLIYALLDTTAAPSGMPSSATTGRLAALAMQVGRDPLLDMVSAQGLLLLAAVLGSAVVLMGLLQIAFGLAGLDRLARFVPQPVLAGFMNGIVLLILMAQLRPLLALPMTSALTDPATLTQIQPWPCRSARPQPPPSGCSALGGRRSRRRCWASPPESACTPSCRRCCLWPGWATLSAPCRRAGSCPTCCCPWQTPHRVPCGTGTAPSCC
jgi:hypothetical protein